MTSRFALRLFIGLFWLFGLLPSALHPILPNWPPPLLQAWTAEVAVRTIPPGLIATLLALTGASIVSSVGLFCFRRWAALIFPVSTILSYAAVALLGPYVVHGAVYACGGFAGMCAGIVTSLCFWSDALKPKSQTA